MSDAATETRFLLRLPTALHTALREAAEREHISMNDLAVAALTSRLGRRQSIVDMLDAIDTQHADVLTALANR